MRKKIFLTLKAVLLIAAVYIAGEIILSKYGLTVTSYEVESDKIQEPFRIVQLTDLHNMSFGKDNSRLIKNIEEQDPDLICMAGDMLNRDEQSLEVVTGLISRLSEKYRVFFSLGNHETAYEENFGAELKDELERAGAVVLNNEYREIRINEETVYIGGISSYGLIEPAGDGSEYEFMKRFESLEGFKLLLCHMPAGMLLWRGLEIWNVDLVLSGHEHGGQVRLPGIGGLYSQDEGLFPEYVDGKFEDSGHILILSRGLGSGGKSFPRFHNIPELVTVDVK